MDFIPFSPPTKEKRPDNGGEISIKNGGNNKSAQKKPVFGSPAIAFGSPAVGFGAGAVGFGAPAQGYGTPNNTPGKVGYGGNLSSRSNTSPVSNNSSYSSSPGSNHHSSSPRHPHSTPRGHHLSPRGHHHSSPRGHYPQHSPRHQVPYTPSPLTGRSNSFDSCNFKTPQQFSPGRGRGSSSVRKSFSAGPYYQQNARYDPNFKSYGGNNIENFYNQGMISDPWKFLKPVIAES